MSKKNQGRTVSYPATPPYRIKRAKESIQWFKFYERQSKGIPFETLTLWALYPYRIADSLRAELNRPDKLPALMRYALSFSVEEQRNQ